MDLLAPYAKGGKIGMFHGQLRSQLFIHDEIKSNKVVFWEMLFHYSNSTFFILSWMSI